MGSLHQPGCVRFSEARRQAGNPPGRFAGAAHGAVVLVTVAFVAGFAAITCAAAAESKPAEMDIVRKGQAVAVVVVEPLAAEPETPAGAEPAARRSGGRSPDADTQAAGVLVDWIHKMTGASLPVVAEAPAEGPAILVGRAAVRAGLKLDDIPSPSREGLRIRCDGRRVLLAGQNDTATIKAACRLLEHFGCRYLMDHPLGEVYPQMDTLSVGPLEITEKPDFLCRKIWGSQWTGRSLWKIWNGAGGVDLSTQHAWGQYVSKDLFATHPEYFRQRDDRREPSDWYCTSNPGLRAEFARGVIARIAAGTTHPSISPPDGRGYCECAACRAQDDPQSIEPSSGHVNLTNRYVDFYQDVAGRVARTYPGAILNFYCYADYTQAPTSGIRLHPNLCAWIAPIRYCRYHHIGQAECPSRRQLAELIDGWARGARKIAYRTYNYNLAECVVPFSKISIWKHDIPYLHRKGCVGINLETLANWQIYGPHIWLSIRLAYDPQADADALMDDYFQRFYGLAAGPMKDYWLGIDRAFAELDCHSGSFFALHRVYTPEFLAACRERIKQATGAARGNATYAARVAAAAEGLQNAEQYIALREAINRGRLQQARQVYDRLLARSQQNVESGLGNHYTVNYLQRFLGRMVEAADEATRPPRRLASVLPDRWRLAYDEADQGVELGYPKPDFDDSAWREVATWSDTLDAQGLPDRQTIMWYRTRFDLPAEARRARVSWRLVFLEIDGDATVFVNGRQLGASEKKRLPFAVDVDRSLLRDEGNVVALSVDHSAITDLDLGGILRPVLLLSAPAAE